MTKRKIRGDAKVSTVRKKYGIPLKGIRGDANLSTARKKLK
jgi:hypothetical protein